MNWRDVFFVEEVPDARGAANDLFKRSFGVDAPNYPRHFVLRYRPDEGGEPIVVAYVHQMPFGEVHLGGGMCVDERIYRQLPKEIFRQVRDEGGLATIVTRGSLSLLGDCVAAFGHVGEPRARQADLRTGYVETGVPHLMAYWRKPLDDAEKARLIRMVEAHGPF